MPVSQLPQAPHRQDRKVFPTPLISDVLFSEIRDCNRILIPEYGTPHPDTAKWPDHKLVLVKPVDIERNEIFEFFYAADRLNQDLYNWSHTEADIGGNKFDAVSREYIIPRSEFDPETPLQGEGMVNIPEDKFIEEYVLASRAVVEAPLAELASIYVFEKRVYVRKVPLIDIEINRETGVAQQIISTLYYRGEAVGDSTIEDLVDDVDNEYWNLDENGFGNVAKQLSENWWEVTQRQWINLEDVWEWELDRRGPKTYYCPSDETTTTVTTSNNAVGPYTPLPDVPIGQLVRILKWGKYMRYITVSRNIEGLQIVDELNYLPDDGYAYPTQNELVSDEEVPIIREPLTVTGRATEYSAIEGCLAVKSTRQVLSLEDETQTISNRLPPDKFFEGGGRPTTTVEVEVSETAPPAPAFGLDESVQRTSKGTIHQTKTTTYDNAIEPTPLPSTSFDQRTGIGYLEYQEVVPFADAVETEVGEDGTVEVFEPYNTDYAIKTTKRVASPETRTWVDIINYEWPPVLEDLYIKTYEKRNGTVLSVPVIKYRSSFTGPQEVNVTQYWQKEPHTPVSPQQMIPEGFRFQCMFFTVDMPPCLHGIVDFAVSTGSNDPVWEPYSETESFPATNYTDWPDTVEWSESKPYMGGYLVTEWVINKPS